MHTKNNTIYADPYRLLSVAGAVLYDCPAQEGVEEIDAPVEDLSVANGMARWAGGRCAMSLYPDETYASLKKRLVKIRYSMDDQIAIMLNDDAEELERMQAWRRWAADVAHKIANRI